MAHAKRKVLVEVGMWIDLAVCGSSLLLASVTVHHPFWRGDSITLTHALRRVIYAIALGFAWHGSLVTAGAYDSFRIGGFRLQAQALLRGSTFATFWALVWICLSWPLRQISGSSLVVEAFVFWTLASSSLLITRIAARVLTGFLRRRGRNRRNVLIVGSNRRAVSIAEGLTADASMGYNLVGFLDDRWHLDDALEIYKQMLIGSLGDILRVLRETALDEVIITLPLASSYQITKHIIATCRKQGILVRCDGSLFDSPKRHVREVDLSSQLISIHDDDRDTLQMSGKRILDIVVSASALVVLSPLLVCIAVVVRMTSPGPSLFVQERLGLGKRRFRMLKFRTMVVDAEDRMIEVEHLNETEGPTFKLTHDPRIAPVGNFLRKTSLDELPQLFNVLVGDMSLVGPRPLPLRDYRGFSEDWHRRRFSVKPGITCLWQVSGRSSIAFDRWMQLDMEYIDGWSLWLDFKILAKTVPVVMRGSGAV